MGSQEVPEVKTRLANCLFGKQRASLRRSLCCVVLTADNWKKPNSGIFEVKDLHLEVCSDCKVSLSITKGRTKFSVIDLFLIPM